ncbi:L-threonylcarbamoyladenylate synthase [Robiginitalea sp. SC105]|uniref:L-threonylcarbamoyladenylate synthase n=1 Tax=Robiginitalea sp. SC105 TaxID=2762332 RepID=UPI00163A51C0|nr:L-threonylcarbamoyladenylate synthase [Robiginitalea sp. SC105]MBC2839959.1 threonylcarbamoyl-AMP synthase [Robiginitalea sp. SC105]
MKEILDRCLETLESGGLLLYPTDTVWGIGCDATNPEAVARVYALKQRPDSKALICLVGSERMLERHIPEVPEVAWDIMELSEKPVTIVYDNPRGVAPNLVASDNTLAVRVASDRFCRDLLRRFRKPLVSTSANLAGEPTPGSFREIGPAILKGVDYVVPLHQENQLRSPSSIIRLKADGQVQVIRA